MKTIPVERVHIHVVGTVEEYTRRREAAHAKSIASFRGAATAAVEPEPAPENRGVLSSIRDLFPNLAPVQTMREAFTVAA